MDHCSMLQGAREREKVVRSVLPAAMRMPSRSKSSMELNGDLDRTRYVPLMMTYGAVNARSVARAGSIARKPTSQALDCRAAKAFPAVSNVTNSTSTLSLLPSSRASSTDTLPRFTCARIFPRQVRIAEVNRGAQLTCRSQFFDSFRSHVNHIRSNFLCLALFVARSNTVH